jgi:NAD(P)-dependent dehydrogenase (short-subunit alcohol dehydrogenase family)
MDEKIVLITGSTDGIGKQTALELARLGFLVLVHGRSLERTRRAVEELARAVPGARFEPVVADFSALREVRRMAGDVLQRFPRLDVLVNNAGVLLRERKLSADGLELTFAVNHLAHFLLTNLLLERLKASAPARIVTVSSSMHQHSSLDFEDLQNEKFSGTRAYSSSKLANVLFTVELAQRLRGSGVTANALDPGTVSTKMLRSAYPGIPGSSLEAGASTSVYLASSPEVEGVSGQYFTRRRPASPSSLVRDKHLCLRLWQVSEHMVGI